MFRKFMMLGMAALLAAALPVSQAKTHKTALSNPIPLTPQQQRLVQEAIAREKVVIRQIQKSTPVVQTYIQDMRGDVKLYQAPVADQYMIGRVDFGKAFVASEYGMKSEPRTHFFSGSMHFMSDLTKAFHLENSPTGFMAMMFVDPSGFDQNHYTFQFVRREFLGSVRTWVFDVQPRVKGTAGRFFGRIWVEDQEGNIVRFNGTYINKSKRRHQPLFPLRQLADECAAGRVGTGLGVYRRHGAQRGGACGEPARTDQLLGLLAEAAHQRDRFGVDAD